MTPQESTRIKQFFEPLLSALLKGRIDMHIQGIVKITHDKNRIIASQKIKSELAVRKILSDNKPFQITSLINLKP